MGMLFETFCEQTDDLCIRAFKKIEIHHRNKPLDNTKHNEIHVHISNEKSLLNMVQTIFTIRLQEHTKMCQNISIYGLMF